MTGWDFDLEIKPTPRLGSSAARSSLFSGCKLFIYWGNGHHGPWFFLVSFTLQPTVLCATGLSRSVPEVLLSNSLGSILLLGAFVRNFLRQRHCYCCCIWEGVTPVVVAVAIVCSYGYSNNCGCAFVICVAADAWIWISAGKWKGKCCWSIDYWILIAGAAF